MSFVPAIRDYFELLNNVYNSLSGDINLKIVLQTSIIYILESLKYTLFYILTFQWLRDFFYLPILIPKISTSILKENLILGDPVSNIFTFLEGSSYTYNKFFIGFFNSFFLSLPISCAHLIFARRLLIQGTFAGLASGLGNILGQVTFIASIIFGLRIFIIPLFSLEPLNYLFGIFLLLTIVYDMSHERVIKIIDKDNTKTLLKIFFLNFLLIWTEQSCIFQYLGNITIQSEPTVLDPFSVNNQIQYVISHLSYLVGILLGNVFFTMCFSIFIKNISEFLQIKLSILRSTWIIRLNFFFLSSILAFSFSSIPYYSLDYLFGGPLGFVSQDKSFKNTLFSPNEVTDPFGVLGALSQNLSLDTDVTPFDRGVYLKSPIFQSFEDLNYAGEYASTTRQGSVPLFGRYKEKARKVRETIRKKDDSIKSLEPESTKNASNNENAVKNQNIETSNNTYSPNSYSKSDNLYISSNLRKRFEANYKDPVNSSFEDIVEGSLNDAFFEENSTGAYPEIEKKIKQKYYANPVYKFLLSIDIDNFLNRQPSNYSLSPTQENDLFKRKLVLNRYYDTLRVYTKLPYNNEFQFLFNGSKSFADRVYNQQFKGTLHIVRRLFSVTPETPKISSENLILKYDQIQYKNYKNETPLLHEEVKEDVKKLSPFLNLTNQIPLYVGWDENLRKLVITNRLLPRSNSGFMAYDDQRKKIIDFTIWPVSKLTLEKPKRQLTIPLRLLYENRNDIKNSEYSDLIDLFEYEDSESEISYYDSLPENLMKLATENTSILPPNRGGFIWPGNSALQFSFKDLLIK
uniref:Hypothetical chloroplast RF1 n=1 Tax=Binuclearia lauterbornii TaxID=3087189 RepID=A0A097KPF0_9CHLO|nr:hypothetical chloroplast RF1 [Binuclearia lauterbornii]AIT95058.1 hypothetical chloroplast RF1 [Binuclearia lauterbornii]